MNLIIPVFRVSVTNEPGHSLLTVLYDELVDFEEDHVAAAKSWPGN